MALPGAPIHHEIDVEGDADPEQQRQGDNVGVVQRHAGDDRHGKRHGRGEQQRCDHEGDLARPAQHQSEQQRDRGDGDDPCLNKRPADQPPRLLDRDRGAGGVRRHAAHRRDETLQRVVVARIALRKHLDPGAPIGGDPALP